MSVTEQFVRFARAEVPQEAATMCRLSLFDWAACGIAGAREPHFAEFVAAERARGQGPATVLGGGRVPAATAALLNGTLSHALDYDDTHFGHIGHPSVAVFPAVIALAQELDAPLDEAVEAATLGIEASVHAGLWLGRGHYQVGYHQTATAGAFGATLATARLLGLDKGEVRAALGLCASMASGLKAQFGTMGKPLNAGLAARTGVEATLWAQAGLTAAEDGLEAFGDTHHGAAAEVKPGRGTWQIMSISHKFHACCHGLHAMLEALGAADTDPDALQSVTVRTHPRWMSVCNIAEPRTGLEAKFSYAQTAAMRLAGLDTGDAANFTDGLCTDPVIVSLRDRVRVTGDDRLTETQAEVTLAGETGALTRLRHDLRDPLPLEALAGKLGGKAITLVGDDRADALWQAAQGDDLHALVAQLEMS